MATTTTNYGFDIPQSTDLVKDGATAIATLGQDIDTAMNTALGTKKAGMVLLNTTSFSAVASQSVNDVFSATYENYVILFNATHATGGDVNIRLRVSSADASTNYTNQRLFGNATTVTTSLNNTTTSWPINIGGGSSRKISRLEVFGPFLTQSTAALNQFGDNGAGYVGINTLGHTDSTSYTGFTLIASAGTLTGNVSVYGFNK
jgi:hypothetical protein